VNQSGYAEKYTSYRASRMCQFSSTSTVARGQGKKVNSILRVTAQLDRLKVFRLKDRRIEQSTDSEHKPEELLIPALIMTTRTHIPFALSASKRERG
jgi:hypothetical protein